jgi:hypothetical protein
MAAASSTATAAATTHPAAHSQPLALPVPPRDVRLRMAVHLKALAHGQYLRAVARRPDPAGRG